MIELEKKNTTQAIKRFKSAISLLPYESRVISFDEHAVFFDALSSGYYKAGELENSLAEYENVISLTTGRLKYGDIYAKAFYMLGMIHEQQGNKAKAKENYEKFLELWKDADPGIAEVEDAKKRLAGLKGQ
jgi:tetratricopeptide (TPR) repeat protein